MWVPKQELKLISWECIHKNGNLLHPCFKGVISNMRLKIQAYVYHGTKECHVSAGAEGDWSVILSLVGGLFLFSFHCHSVLFSAE
jgi:hypothetical protein